MTIPELIQNNVRKITHPSWTHGHLEIMFDKDGKRWFMLMVDHSNGRKYPMTQEERNYYLQYEDYVEC